MYEGFYGLKRRPFSKTPDPAFLFRSRSHAEALERLRYAVEERELAVLTGEIGTGKTTLSRALIDSLGDDHRVVLVLNPRLSPSQLLKLVAKRLGVDRPAHGKTDLVDQINEALFREREAGRSTVILIDEAQLIPGKPTFDEIRLLTNFQLDDENLIALILVGQPELRERLRKPGLRALRQRVGIQFHLGPLGREEVAAYVAFRLGVAGREEPLFTDAALDRLHLWSGGLPREINNLAANSLLAGYGRDLPRIDADILDEVAGDLGYEEGKPPHHRTPPPAPVALS